MPVASAFRLTEPPDVGHVMSLASAHNPFFSRDDIVDREVVTDRIGLLVADRASVTTLLYLWTRTIDDVSPWMAHAAQWFEHYADWRTAHDLAPSSASVAVVLAAPGMEPTVRSALRLVSCPVRMSRYIYGELGGKAVLGWEADSENSSPSREGPVRSWAQRVFSGKLHESEELTPQEVEFFRRG